MSYLIAIDGIDGCGKTTLVAKVANELSARNIPVVTYTHPTKDLAIGRLIRRAFTGEEKVDPACMLHLMTADALECEFRIQTALAAHNVVVLDRHTMVSSFVYQTEVHPLNVVLQTIQPERFQRPDAVFILDCPVEIAIGRIQGRGGKDAYYENVEHQTWETRRNKYVAWQFCNPGNTVLLDGQQRPEVNVNTILGVLDQLQTTRMRKN